MIRHASTCALATTEAIAAIELCIAGYIQSNKTFRGMPRVQDEQRKRLYRPKNRTGCRTCKRRHVRCDESRPECSQCTSRNRACEGYEVELRRPSALRIEISTAESIFESQHEHRAFAYFRERTSTHLTGLLENVFWNRVVLQLARSNASVRHSLIALATVHEDFEMAQSSRTRANAFALRHYNRAIRFHVEHSRSFEAMTASDVMSYLVSCAVFVCIEMLQAHTASAISLIKQAVRLFYGLSLNDLLTVSSAWSADLFEGLLCRFQSIAIGLIGRAAFSGSVPPRIKAARISAMPTRFSSVQQAKDYLSYYIFMHELSRRPSSTGYIHDPTERDKETCGEVTSYYSILSHWSFAFDAFKTRIGEASLSGRDYRTIVVLDVRKCFLTRLADFSRWDDFRETFQEMLDQIESVLDSLPSTAPFAEPGRQHFFTLEVGIVSPLFMVARGCRDPFVRRRAIELLRRFTIREGLWDSRAAARVAERIMLLEEGAVDRAVFSAQEIPTWARIPETGTAFDLDKHRMVIKTVQRATNIHLQHFVDLEEYVAN